MIIYVLLNIFSILLITRSKKRKETKRQILNGWCSSNPKSKQFKTASNKEKNAKT